MRKCMIKRGRKRNNLHKRNLSYRNGRSKKSHARKILMQIIISSIVVMAIVSLKVEFIDGQKYLNKVKYILEYNLDFEKELEKVQKIAKASYAGVQKKAMEVLKIYENSEFR